KRSFAEGRSQTRIRDRGATGTGERGLRGEKQPPPYGRGLKASSRSAPPGRQSRRHPGRPSSKTVGQSGLDTVARNGPTPSGPRGQFAAVFLDRADLLHGFEDDFADQRVERRLGAERL